MYSGDLNVVQATSPNISGVTTNTGMQSGTLNPQGPTINPQAGIPLSGSGGYVQGAATTNNTPVAPPPPTYRDAYGNVRMSQAAADAASANGRNAVTSMNNYTGANDVQWQNFQTGFNQRGRGLVSDASSNQNTINTSRGNTALNLRRGMSGIANAIRTGLRSGGVNLANLNALDSGAAEAMARAYGRSGTRQVGDIRNQAATANRTLDTDQFNLGQFITNGVNDLRDYGVGQVRTQATSLGQNLDALRAGLETDGLGGLIDTNRDEAWRGGADQWVNDTTGGFQGQLNGVRAWTPEEIEARAYEWDMAGRDGGSPFSTDGYSLSMQFGAGSEAPGVPISQLPLYTRRRQY